jgi:hypothetical protein
MTAHPAFATESPEQGGGFVGDGDGVLRRPGDAPLTGSGESGVRAGHRDAILTSAGPPFAYGDVMEKLQEMDPERLLLVWGMVLLAVAALLGFVQHRHRTRPESFARWRVVHTGGTAGAVQLLGLAAVWGHFGRGAGVTLLAVGVVTATIAVFLGPRAHALSLRRTGSAILLAGAFVALPSYAALPLLLIL